MDKTPGQVAANAVMLELEDRRGLMDGVDDDVRSEMEQCLAGIIDKSFAHVRPQIEQEARACASEDVLVLVSEESSDGYAYLPPLADKIRALATLQSGFVCVSKKPTEEMVEAGAASMLTHAWESSTEEARTIFKAMIAGRKV